MQPNARSDLPEVIAGFIPLLDCAPFVIAREKGFDTSMGFRFALQREVSWANIRDKLDVGAFDCAHALAPLPLAATLGLGRATEPLIVPMSLSLNGNAITVSKALFAEMQEADPIHAKRSGLEAAKALAKVVREREARGREPLTLGMVYPFSAHNYDLRYWLASAGIDPDVDLNLVVVPPPLVVQSLSSGRVDGFCVGEPWNSLAVSLDLGVIVATKSELWARSPEKVLAVREAWAERNPDLLDRIIRALVEAGRWLGTPENSAEASEILARPSYVGVEASVLMRSLTGPMQFAAGEARAVPEMVLFDPVDVSFPWRSHAIWYLTQMIRWGQIREPFNIQAVASRIYRPDLYRRAVAPLSIPVPTEDMKPEGGITFFGSDRFDPKLPIDYLSAFSIRMPAADLARFATENS